MPTQGPKRKWFYRMAAFSVLGVSVADKRTWKELKPLIANGHVEPWKAKVAELLAAKGTQPTTADSELVQSDGRCHTRRERVNWTHARHLLRPSLRRPPFPTQTSPRRAATPPKLVVTDGVTSEAMTADMVQKILADREFAEREFARAKERAQALRIGGYEMYEKLCDDFNPVAGTAWAAYNAVTELATWREGPQADSALMFGVRSQEIQRGYEAAAKLVAGTVA